MKQMTGTSRYLSVNGTEVKSPVFLASMAGITDAAYVLSRKESVGGAFIGGYSIDDPTIAASKEMEGCGRKEFTATLDDIAAELDSLKGQGLVIGVNLRGTTPEAYLAAAKRFGTDCIIEIDAHCRQKPMNRAGAGEVLLADIPRLCAIVSALHAAGYCVSVKFRAGIADDRDLAAVLWKAGADILHVDLMDFGHAKLRQIRNSCPLVIIGNNGVTSPDVMMDYFSHGADLVSLARGAHPDLLADLSAYSAEMAETVGWYNAPKQVCRGGDWRGLAFCCMPIKQCPLLPTLSAIGMEYQEYVDLKMQAVAGTPLEPGNSTCFGSLAYCCKSSTPCMFRDMSLMEAGLSKPEYMRLKRGLSQAIMQKIFAGDRKP
ncbi:MAG TPA: methanogenesis marker 9 domain-containing protein [Methanocorpusculum sp.]|nr:methanogenesis marker 9 domain-containing protein [Methanocorpusculum sp.]